MDVTSWLHRARQARQVVVLVLGAIAIAVVAIVALGRSHPAVAAGCDGTIAYGEVMSCPIATSGATQSITFPGVNAHVVRIRVIVTGGTLNPLAEVRKGATSVCAQTFADEFSCTMPSSGTFTLVVKDSGTGTGTFATTVQDLNAPVGCSSVPFNTAGVTGTISATAEMDCFTQTGATGQNWHVRAVETSGSLFATVDVIRPDGTTLCSTSSTEQSCVLDAAGTYTILVRDSAGTNTGDYRLELEKFPGPTGCTALTFNTPASVTITKPGAIACFTFPGTGKPDVRVRSIVTSGAINPLTQTLRPDGSVICPDTFADELGCQLDATGTHTLFIRDANGPALGTIAVLVQNLNAPVGCTTIPFNSRGVTGKISATAEMDCFRRAGTVGQNWHFRTVETSGSIFTTVDLIRPDGTTLCSTSSTEGSCVLDQAGTYTFLVRDSAGTNTGDYRLELEKFPNPVGCTALNFNLPATALFTRPGQIACFTFPGTGKPNVRIRAIVTAGAINPLTETLRPDGSVICPDTFADEFSCQLDATGTHTLFIRDANGPALGTVAVVAQNLNAPVGCSSVPFNTTGVTGTISGTAEMDCFTQTGAVGQNWHLRTVETSGSIFTTVDLIRPDGTTLCSTSSTEGSCVLDQAGTYVVLVRDSAGTNTGDYRLELEKFPSPNGCTALTFNTPATVTISQPGAIGCVTFSGTGKPNVRVRSIVTSGAINPLTQTLRPDGSVICPDTFADEFGCQLDATGTHTLFIRDATGPAIGTVSVLVQNLNAPVGCSSVPFNTAGVTGTISATAEMDCFTQTGAVGQSWHFRSVETSGTLFTTVDLIRPDGTTLCSTSSTEGSCVLDQAGTYLVLVRDSAGTNTGDYRLELEKFPSPSGCTALTFGTPATATITQPGAISCFTFSGAGKPNVRIQAIVTGGTINPLTQTLRPDGSVICADTFSDDFTCQLDATGTQTLFIRDATGPATGTVSVEVSEP